MIAIDCNSGVAAVALRTDPCNLFFELAHRFPGQPVNLRIAAENIILFQSAQAATEILQTKASGFVKNLGPFMSYFGKSRLTTDGLDWRGQQKISQPYISGRNTETISALTRAHYERAAAAMLAAQTQNSQVAIESHLDHAALGILLNAVFGIEERDLGESFVADMRAVFDARAESAWDLSGTGHRNAADDQVGANAASERIMAALERLRASLAERSELKDGLLAHFAAAEQQGLSFAAEVCTLVFAGFDTTSSALSWIIFLLARDIELQRKLRHEIVAAAADAEFGPDDIEKTPLLPAVISEALRAFPAVPMISRFAAATGRIDGVALLRGQRIILSIIGLHHNSTHWNNPKSFDASRFPAGVVPPALETHYRPFSLGQRGCGGMRFARLELAVALATLLRRIEFQAAGKIPLAFTWRISMRLKGGLGLSCRPPS